jgi:hypothetical protein
VEQHCSGNFFQDFKLLPVSCCPITRNHLCDCWQAIAQLSLQKFDAAASGNLVVGNVIRDTGSDGSFGTRGIPRVPYSVTSGIDLEDEECRHRTVQGNGVADKQTNVTTASALHDGGDGSNVIIREVFSMPSAERQAKAKG